MGHFTKLTGSKRGPTSFDMKIVCTSVLPLLCFSLSCDGSPGTDGAEGGLTDENVPGIEDGELFRADVWADNWFAMYMGEELLKEDSVSITTERSFNRESFQFTATRPAVLSFILKDYKENDSGLEYIGERNQQMGDGGLIAQITEENSGEVVAVSNADWRCLVVHRAPLNKECESSSSPESDCEYWEIDEPEGWKNADFDDSEWTEVSVHSEAAVSPKDGYDEISWDSEAQLIWGADLESDNTILCRMTLE